MCLESFFFAFYTEYIDIPYLVVYFNIVIIYISIHWLEIEANRAVMHQSLQQKYVTS